MTPLPIATITAVITRSQSSQTAMIQACGTDRSTQEPEEEGRSGLMGKAGALSLRE
jgi:hypothetical protein